MRVAGVDALESRQLFAGLNVPASLAVDGVTASSGQVSWADTSTTENRYRVMASTAADFSRDLVMVTPGANATQGTLTNLLAGKLYYVRVRAEASPEVGDWSSVVTFTPGSATTPHP